MVDNHQKGDKEMTHWYDEFDEMPDEYLEEETQNSIEAKAIEAPDVAWKEDIEKIENTEIKKKKMRLPKSSSKKKPWRKS